jgi:carbon monoxide dehydrogenase subunit G
MATATHAPAVRDGALHPSRDRRLSSDAQWLVARYTITTHVAAPPEHVFALWTNLARMGDWVGGVTGVSDVSGAIDQVGTTYVVHFGPVKSPTEVLEVERPRLFSTRFGSWILRGRSSATFEPDGDGTRITQTFETVGLISAISSWVFSRGSYEGSFRGELETFARLAEREATPPPG